uniref:Phosphoribosyl-AMP cyclohydrolase n=1 Tax=Desertifilum tharense IPPAS B-1220 TaxID=1781255 RepID=A0ACD5GRW6_9CYAN
MSSPLSANFLQAIPVDQIRYNEQGLVPAIVQDYLDGTVLMMAWMNAESLQKTLETGQTWFWSRSRSQFWHKGETSGTICSMSAASATTVTAMRC